MTAPPFLSRVRLARTASVQALAPLLLGGGAGGHGSIDADHRLVWSLFADGPDRRRDFLWRRMDDGAFLVLSARPPEDGHGLFEIDEPKPFAPALEPGDRLRFSLRANPTVRPRDGERRHAPRHDVVMDALNRRPAGARAEQRAAAIREEGLAWLARRGEAAGFAVREGETGVEGYRQHSIGRRRPRNASEAKRPKPMTFSTLDFDGVLEVRDPPVFVAAVARGFGPAKAFGCGLMLVRRA